MCLSVNIVSLFKVVTFIVCFTGFAVQIRTFITQFYTYPTVLNIELQKPDVYLKPAVTICDNNIAKRSVFCSKYPDKCQKPENLTVLCKERPFFCNKKNMSDFLVAKEKEFFYHYNHLMTKEDWQTLPPQHEDMLPWEFEDWDSFEGPFYFRRFKKSKNDTTNYNYSCFTVNSRILSNEEAMYVNPKNSTFREDNSEELNIIWLGFFLVNVEEDEQIDEYDPRGFISVHSPFNLDDPAKSLIPLEPGKIYEIFTEIKKEVNLPYPYKTDCIDYEELWRNANRTGPRSRQICRMICMDQYEWRCFNCSEAPWEILNRRCLGNEQSICSPKEKQNELEKVEICKAKCKTECTRYRFPFKIIGRPHNSVAFRDKYGRKLIEVNMNIAEPEILVYQHVPKYLDVELFSNIGGIVGIWLGVSIWAVSHTLFKLPVLVFYLCLEKLNVAKNSL